MTKRSQERCKETNRWLNNPGKREEWPKEEDKLAYSTDTQEAKSTGLGE